MKKINKIKQQLESVGYYVEIADMDGKYLIVKKKFTSKNTLFELIFDKKHNLTHIVAGKKINNATWIKLQ